MSSGMGCHTQVAVSPPWGRDPETHLPVLRGYFAHGCVCCFLCGKLGSLIAWPWPFPRVI